MSSSASRTRSNIASCFIFAPSRQQNNMLKLHLRAETAWTGCFLGNLPSFVRGRAKWQMAKSRLPGHVHPLLLSPCPSSLANFEDVQFLSDQGGKLSAGIVHTISSHSSIVPSSIFDESHSNKVDSRSECGEEEEEGVEKRRGTGNNLKLFTYFKPIVAKGPQWRTSVSPPSLHWSLVPSSLL